MIKTTSAKAHKQHNMTAAFDVLDGIIVSRSPQAPIIRNTRAWTR
ncbi:MAG: hypothetical protein AB7W28_05745 [Armatimonadota bacterium]